MKKKIKAGLSMVLAVCLFVLFIPVNSTLKAGATTTYADPKVSYVLDDGLSSITKGMPFGATFTFTDDNIPGETSHVEITVSSPNGSISIGFGTNPCTVSPFFSSTDTNSDGSTGVSHQAYKVYLPEKQLRYLGTGAGTLKFRIIYKETASNGSYVAIPNYSYVVQKTIKECVYSSDSTTTSDSGILIDENSSMPTIQAGMTGTVAIPLISNGLSGDVHIVVGMPEGGKILPASAGSTYTLNFSSGEKKNLSLSLSVDSSVTAGVYPLTLTVDSKPITAYVRVLESSGGSGKLSLQGYTVSRTTVKEGDSFLLSLTVKNNSSTSCKNVAVTLGGLATDSITVNGALDTKNLTSLAAGATTTLSFPLLCSSRMASGNYILDVSLSADGMDKPVTAKTFVLVQGTKTDKDDSGSNASKPLIVIQSYNFGGKSVTGGKVFTLAMKFKNTNLTTAIENVKMTVASAADKDTGGAFTPASSSNTFFIPKVGAGAVFSQNIDLYPQADAVPKSYGITVSFKYEAVLGGKRESLEAEETISIPLTQPDRFEVTDAELATPIYMNEGGQLTINYVNKGKSKIFNLSVALEGNFTATEMSSYIGNVDTGTSDSFDTTLTPTAEGKLSGKATFTYEDANGDTKTIVKEFSSDVMAAQTGEGSAEPGMSSGVETTPQKAGGMPAWVIWIIIGVGVAVAVVAVIFIRKKLKKKKQRLLDENDDYDELPGSEDKPK